MWQIIIKKSTFYSLSLSLSIYNIHQIYINSHFCVYMRSSLHLLIDMSAALSTSCDLHSHHACIQCIVPSQSHALLSLCGDQHLTITLEEQKDPLSPEVPHVQKGNALKACLDTKTNSSTSHQRGDREFEVCELELIHGCDPDTPSWWSPSGTTQKASLSTACHFPLALI